MDMLKVVLTSSVSIVYMFILTRLIGRRQMSQLSLFDYAVGITIGSIAAEMATDVEQDVMLPMIAMAVYTVVTILISLGNSKSRQFRSVFQGKPVVIYEKGKLYYQNLKKTKMDLSEFLMLCRNNGYFDLSELRLAVMEPNGRVSFLPLEQNRPLTPKDMSMQPPEKCATINIVMDGVTLVDCLKASGNNPEWLQKQLSAQGYDSPSEALLATVDDSNVLTVYERNEGETHKPLFD